ncbi:MAG: TetR/AcrR family transcriptional regulator [Lachnospiraceae bacterium]|nr:TetR/AcrR family transcriptional regulator [Lachnospiraceae bacterium]MBP3505790.1 TetR/AcrR family transcriptional regulator [Lachnospiraceae bacterium]
MEVKTDNRKNILNCAIHLFYQKGYDAVGVQEIATAASVTKPTLYYYFKSKLGLLEALLKERCEPICDRLERIAKDYQGEPKDTLYALACELVDIAKEDREFYFLLLSLNYSARENEAFKAVYPYMKRMFHITTAFFLQAGDKLGNMNGRQEQFAIAFQGIINHYILVMDERDSSLEMASDPHAIWELVRQFMYGIYS